MRSSLQVGRERCDNVVASLTDQTEGERVEAAGRTFRPRWSPRVSIGVSRSLTRSDVGWDCLAGCCRGVLLTLEQQAERVRRQLQGLPTDLARNLLLDQLHYRNEVLYFKVLAEHPTELMPVVYPPTVGEAIQWGVSAPSQSTPYSVAPTSNSLVSGCIRPRRWAATSLVYPPACFAAQWLDQLEATAKSGNASFYASGVFPGFASDQLALMLSTQSKSIRTLKVTEVALNDHYPVASVMMDGMGFGRPLDFEPMLSTPGFIQVAWNAPIHLIAEGLGVEVHEILGSLDRRPTDRDIEVAFGTIEAGTCGAVLTRAAGVVDGHEVIVIEHIIRIARDLAARLVELPVRRDLSR
jgi:2,4-diaminopentanoate dehydrogenase C-terminal domain/Malic enzyme, N-terminal domain